MKTKSRDEIEQIAQGAAILSRVMANVVGMVRVGATGTELNSRAEQLIHDAGGEPAFKGYGEPPFPAALCISVNACVVHGVPGNEAFTAGDIIGLDLGVLYKGFYSDMARTIALDPISEREKILMDTTKEALDRAIAMVKPGITTGDIGSMVQKFAEARGLGVVRDLAGHGIGYQLHEKPELPNFGTPGGGTSLVVGMVLAFEPMLTLGDWKVIVADDKWSVQTKDGSKSAHFEDMIEVTEHGHRILTR